DGTVPPFRASPPVPSSETSSNLYPNPMNEQSYYGSQQHYHTSENLYSNTIPKTIDEKYILEGIPFVINPKYLSENRNGVR
ncbi:unnamed protein product, partial [Rotaria sp. Silwood1]